MRRHPLTPLTAVAAVAACTVALALAGCPATGAVPPAGGSTHGTPGSSGAAPAAPLHVQILAINDFHGQLQAGRRVGGRPVGGAGVLAAYLKAAQRGLEDRTIIVHAGDHVGASPPASALLQDEPSIMLLNLLANRFCSYEARLDPRCNLVGTPGNHEFDEGVEELLRLIRGGTHPAGPFLEAPYRGARFPYVSANVVDARTGRPILPPYVVKEVQGVPVGFVGAVLEEAPAIVAPGRVEGLEFLDEAEAINRYAGELADRGVQAIVVLVHQGGRQAPYPGSTRPGGRVTGDIVSIVSRLDDEVDVVISGHWHAFTNALLENAGGREVLVVQAFSAGTAYADVDLEVDPASGEVVSKRARIVTTFADAGPGLRPDPQAAALAARAEARVAPLASRVVGVAAAAVTREANEAGESALGNLIADAHRAATGSDFAFTNRGGIRADIEAGPVTWGELFAVQPFADDLVQVALTGEQIYALLEQQWATESSARILAVSGLAYTWDAARPPGSRVVEVRKDGRPIDRRRVYSVTVNSYLAAGRDGFTLLAGEAGRVAGTTALEALVAYVERLPRPFTCAVEGRIERLH